MILDFHEHNGEKVAEIRSGGIVIQSVQDMLDALSSAYGGGADSVILHQAQLHSDFFRLKTRFAGEILQKAVTYHMRIAIIGDWNRIESENLTAFIRESNRGNQIFFVADLDEAKSRLAPKPHERT